MASLDSFSTASKSSLDRDFFIIPIIEDAAPPPPPATPLSTTILGEPRKGSVDNLRTVEGDVDEVNTPKGERARPTGGERHLPGDRPAVFVVVVGSKSERGERDEGEES